MKLKYIVCSSEVATTMADWRPVFITGLLGSLCFTRSSAHLFGNFLCDFMHAAQYFRPGFFTKKVARDRDAGFPRYVQALIRIDFTRGGEWRGCTLNWDEIPLNRSFLALNGDFMHRRVFLTSRHSSRRMECGDWPVPWKLHNVINWWALFDIGVDTRCTSNAVHKVPTGNSLGYPLQGDPQCCLPQDSPLV